MFPSGGRTGRCPACGRAPLASLDPRNPAGRESMRSLDGRSLSCTTVAPVLLRGSRQCTTLPKVHARLARARRACESLHTCAVNGTGPCADGARHPAGRPGDVSGDRRRLRHRRDDRCDRRRARRADPGRRARAAVRGPARAAGARPARHDRSSRSSPTSASGCCSSSPATRSICSASPGEPLRLALLGWLVSLALAYSIGGVLAAAGIVLSLALHGLGAGDDRDRHADPDPVRLRRAAHPLRHLPAGGRRGRRVRADPAADADPLDRRAPFTTR